MNKKEKYDMKPIVTIMDDAIAKLSMNQEKIVKKWGYKAITNQKVIDKLLLQDLDLLGNHIKKDCAKKLIDKIFIGVDRKHTVGWHSYFKIGNQTFYMTTCETKNEAEWFAEQLTLAIMSIAQAIKED